MILRSAAEYSFQGGFVLIELPFIGEYMKCLHVLISADKYENFFAEKIQKISANT